jgi:hypothetical protein
MIRPSVYHGAFLRIDLKALMGKVQGVKFSNEECTTLSTNNAAKPSRGNSIDSTKSLQVQLSQSF